MSVFENKITNIDPAILIPECARVIAEYTQLKTCSDPDPEKKNSSVIFLKNIMALFNDPALITAERVTIGLCSLDILKTHPELYAGERSEEAYFMQLQEYLCMVFNASLLTRFLREDT